MVSDDELALPSKAKLGKCCLVKGRMSQKGKKKIPGAHNLPVLELCIRNKIFSV